MIPKLATALRPHRGLIHQVIAGPLRRMRAVRSSEMIISRRLIMEQQVRRGNIAAYAGEEERRALLAQRSHATVEITVRKNPLPCGVMALHGSAIQARERRQIVSA